MRTPLLPTCQGTIVASSVQEVEALLAGGVSAWPEGWSEPAVRPTLPEIYRTVTNGFADPGPLRASAQGLRYVAMWKEKFAKGANMVTMTLRQHKGGAARNSNIGNWKAFASGITSTRFVPVFVPDTERAFDVAAQLGSDFLICQEAAWNIGLRMALYESAYLNLFVNNGPASLCVLSGRCRYLMFKVTTPSLRLTSVDYLAELGFRENESPRFATAFQKWVWSDDTSAVLLREFDQMVRAIDSRNEDIPSSAIGS